MHHKIAVVDGGTDEQSNLILLCGDCHREWHRVEGAVSFDRWLDTPSPLFLIGAFLNLDECGEMTLIQLQAHWHIHVAERRAEVRRESQGSQMGSQAAVDGVNYANR